MGEVCRKLAGGMEGLMGYVLRDKERGEYGIMYPYMSTVVCSDHKLCSLEAVEKAAVEKLDMTKDSCLTYQQLLLDFVSQTKKTLGALETGFSKVMTQLKSHREQQVGGTLYPLFINAGSKCNRFIYNSVINL